MMRACSRRAARSLDRGTILQDSWQHFCESFSDYLEEGRERAARVAKQAREEGKRNEVLKAESVVYRRQVRWNDYIRVAGISWPGMPDADREFVATVTAGSEVDDVDEERFERSLAVFRRYKNHTKEALLEEKRKLRDKLTQCASWARRYDAEGQREYAQTIKELSEWIDITTNIETLNQESYPIHYLHDDLDPSRPPFDPETDPF
jgi:hypothetical protein